MTLQVYAYTRAADAVVGTDRLTGIAGAAVSSIVAGPLAVVVSQHDHVPAERAAALAHAATVDAVTARVAAVPVRFGHVVADAATLRAAVATQAPRLERLLADLGDRLEVALHAEVTDRRPPLPPRAQGGRAYLLGRLDQERAARQVERAARTRLAEAARTLGPHAVTTSHTSGSRGPEVCFLVERGRVDELLAAARTLAAEGGVRVSGPWPPYSFAALHEEAPA